MVTGRAYMDHYHAGQGGVVPIGLHFWDRPPFVPERIRPVPQAQHRPLHGHGVPPLRCPEGAPKLSWVSHVVPFTSPPKSLTREDFLFADLRQEISKTPQIERLISPWILEETWRFVDTRVAL